MNQKAIGARIQQARNDHGLTQEQLAEMVGLTPTHISVLERGAKPPKFNTFIAIANALNVSADELLVDVLYTSSDIRSSWLSKELDMLSADQKSLVVSVVETMVQQMKNQ